MQNITYEINKKEKFYYGFSLIISLILYYVLLKNSEFLIYLIPYVIYIVIFVFHVLIVFDVSDFVTKPTVYLTNNTQKKSTINLFQK